MYQYIKEWFEAGIYNENDIADFVPYVLSESDYQTITGIPYEEKGGEHATS